MNADDVTRLTNWQNTNGLKLDMAFNGAGSEEAIETARRPRPAHRCLPGQQVPVPLDQPHLEPPAARRADRRLQIRERDRPEHPVAQAQQRALPIDPDGAGDRRALRAAQCRDAGSDQPDRHPLDRGRQLARADPLRDRPGDDGAPVPLERLLQRRDPWRSSSTSTTTSTCPRPSAASASTARRTPA